MKKVEKRNPLNEKPLHSAGQSLDRDLAEIRFSKILLLVLFFFMLIQLLGDWWSWYRREVSSPIPQAVFLAIAGIGAIVLNSRLTLMGRNIKLGRDGEKIVGQVLDGLKTQGYAVIHDVVAKTGKTTFNIDHIIVAPQGIFAVETKTYSKTAKEPAKAHYDGEKVVMAGRQSDRTSVKQAQANASWLRKEIEKKTQRDYPVTPVVVYPGWWVDDFLSNEIWVLNPEMLAVRLTQQLPRIGELEVNHLTYLLALMASDD